MSGRSIITAGTFETRLLSTAALKPNRERSVVAMLDKRLIDSSYRSVCLMPSMIMNTPEKSTKRLQSISRNTRSGCSLLVTSNVEEAYSAESATDICKESPMMRMITASMLFTNNGR